MTGAAPITDIARSLDAGAPIVLVNADDARAPPDLGRARLQRDQRADRALIIHPGRQPRRGHALHRRAAQHEGRRSGAIIPPSADFLAYRDNTPTGDSGQGGAPGRTWRDLHDARRRRRRAQRPLSRLGLHRRERAQPHRAPALHARRRASRASAANAPAFTVDHRSTNDVDARHLPARDRHVRGRALRRQHDAAGARFVLDAERPAGPPGDAAAGDLHLHHPARGAAERGRSGGAGAGVDLRPRPARLEHRGAAPATSGTWPTSTTSSSAPPSGSAWPTRTSRNAVDILQNSRNFPSLTDRLQQSMLNQLFLARLMIHPQGFVSDPAFQDASGNPVIDTSASSTTATARAASSAARSWRSRRTSRAACSACPA